MSSADEDLRLYFAYECPSSRTALMAVYALALEDRIALTCYNLIEKEHINDEYRKINPRLKVPALTIGSDVITESRAIIMYLADRFLSSENTLYPRELFARSIINAALFFDIAVVYGPIHDFVLPQCLPGVPEGDKDAAEKKASSSLDEMELLFSDNGPYCRGPHLTLADISSLGSLVMLLGIDYPLQHWPKISAWMRHCQEELKFFDTCNKPGIDRLKTLYALKHKA